MPFPLNDKVFTGLLGPYTVDPSFTDQWTRQQLGSGGTGSWDKEFIPTEQATTIVPPEGGFRGTADPGFLDYISGIVGGVLSPSALMGGIPGLGEDIGRRAFEAAQTRRGVGEAVGAIPEDVSREIVGWSGLPPVPPQEDPIAKFKAQMASPVGIAPETSGRPAMSMAQEPVNLQAPAKASPGVVRAYDPRSGKSYDYSGGKSEVTLMPQGNAAGPGFQAPSWVGENPADRYKPSEMDPKSSAFAMFGGPSPGEVRAQQYAAGQAKIGGEQVRTAQDQYLLEQAKQFGPQVLTGRPARPQMLEEIEGLASLRATRKEAVIPEAARQAKATYEKAFPGKSFDSLSEDNKRAAIEQEADKLLETGDYGRALKTWLSSKGLVGFGG